ncbi:hypothetical protein G6F50_018083 [Rhizopus delemar]|uniref:Uncharacterized protein n=1 Tax=Rhizopus delemar TaxID=936053 RepID=A0A9P7BZW2_9FUNG|nr:hypothetical protein G6F50_018083 [Rhizopus delemar]
MAHAVRVAALEDRHGQVHGKARVGHRAAAAEQAAAGFVAAGGGAQVHAGVVAGLLHRHFLLGHRHAGLLRTAAGQVIAFAGDAHQPAHALDHEVIRRGLMA